MRGWHTLLSDLCFALQSIFADTETEWEILIETVDNIFETLREMQTQKNSVIK